MTELHFLWNDPNYTVRKSKIISTQVLNSPKMRSQADSWLCSQAAPSSQFQHPGDEADVFEPKVWVRCLSDFQQLHLFSAALRTYDYTSEQTMSDEERFMEACGTLDVRLRLRRTSTM